MEYLAYLLYFIQSWLVFVVPLKFLRYKSTIGQRVVFTIVYAVGSILSREIYKFLKVPFGTHTFLLIIFGIILLKIVAKGFGWQKSIYAFLITFIVLLINDTFIVLPVMKLFGFTIGGIEMNSIFRVLFICIMPNLLLILAYIALVVRDLVCSKKGSNGTVFGPIGGK